MLFVFLTNLVTQTSALNYHTLNRSIKRYIFKVEMHKTNNVSASSNALSKTGLFSSFFLSF